MEKRSEEVMEMSRTHRFGLISVTLMAALIMSFPVHADEGDFVKWYGFGGELSEPHRWLGRLGITEDLGAEIIFGLEHRSDDCDSDSDSKDCDFTKIDMGAGFIYDFVPASRLTPYVAGRFILSMLGNGTSETSGTVEAAGGVEYVIMKRLGISGELNFNFGTNPSEVKTTTVVRFYFYL
jgi:hypothetical protein